MKVCFHVILVFRLKFICRYNLKYPTRRLFVFLGEGIAIISMSEPMHLEVRIFQYCFELEWRWQPSQKD